MATMSCFSTGEYSTRQALAFRPGLTRVTCIVHLTRAREFKVPPSELKSGLSRWTSLPFLPHTPTSVQELILVPWLLTLRRLPLFFKAQAVSIYRYCLGSPLTFCPNVKALWLSSFKHFFVLFFFPKAYETGWETVNLTIFPGVYQTNISPTWTAI